MTGAHTSLLRIFEELLQNLFRANPLGAKPVPSSNVGKGTVRICLKFHVFCFDIMVSSKTEIDSPTLCRAKVRHSSKTRNFI